MVVIKDIVKVVGYFQLMVFCLLLDDISLLILIEVKDKIFQVVNEMGYWKNNFNVWIFVKIVFLILINFIEYFYDCYYE